MEDGLGSRVSPTLTGHTATQPRKDYSCIPASLWGKPGVNLGTVLSVSALEPQSQRWAPSHLWGSWGHNLERKRVEVSPWSQTCLLEATQLMPYCSGVGPPSQTSGKACPAQTWSLKTPTPRAEDG